MSPKNNRPNPYVGPRAFQTGEKLYGRDSELQQLLDLFIAERIVLLYSPSGAGKSSLVQAGLVPCLREEGFQVLPVARVNLEPPPGFTPGPGFNRYTFSALLSLEEGQPPEAQIPLTQLGALSLEEYLSRRPRGENEPDTQVLILDQFEEILTRDPMDREGKLDFFTQLGAALRNRKRWALLSMREDYVPSLDPYLRPVPTRLANTFRLDLLGIEPARQAIQNPARAAGVELTDPAARKLADDLRRVQVQRPDGVIEEQLGPYVEPVQLQVVCYRLWQNLAPDQAQITEADLAAVGDVDQSLAEYYAERVAAIAAETGVRERHIREWCDQRLITEQGIRGQVLMGPEQSDGLDNRAIRLLENAHLVRAEKRRGATWFELAHDRLLTPVRRNNAAWAQAHLSLLQRQATLWDRQDRLEALLLRDKDLEEAQQWADAHPTDLTDIDRDFLAASREICAREEAARTAAERQLKLEAAEKVAEAERRRAEEQARHASQLRKRAAALVFFLVIALAMAGIAAFFWNQSNENVNLQRTLVVEKDIVAAQNAVIAAQNARIAATSQANEQRAISESNAAATAEAEAELQRGTAVAERLLAENARLEAEEQRDRANTLRKEALSNSLALLSAEYIDRQPDLGLLLGIESYRWNPASWQATSALLSGLARYIGSQAEPYDGRSLPDSLIGIQEVSFSPDGQKLAWGGVAGEVSIWDRQSGSARRLSVPSQDTINTVEYNHRGTLLAAGNNAGKVIVWNTGTGRIEKVINTSFSSVLDVAFSPDDGTLAVAGTSKSIYLWDMNQWTYKSSLSPKTGAGVFSLAWSPNGKRLAAGGADRQVRIWNVESGLEERRLEGHEGSILSLAWSPNGKWLVSGGNDDVKPRDKTLIVWDVNQRSFRPLSGHLDQVLAVAFSPDSRILASGSKDQTVILWDTNGFLPIETLKDAGNWVKSLDFTRQGERLLAAASFDQKIRLYRLETQESLSLYQTLAFLGEKVKALAALQGGTPISAVTERAGSTRFWEVQGGEGSQSLRGAVPFQAISAAASPDGRLVALGGVDGVIQVRETQSGTVQLEFGQDGAISPGPVLSLAFHPNGKTLAVAVCLEPLTENNLCLKNEIQVWDFGAAPPRRIDRFETFHIDSILSLAFSPDGNTLASGGQDRVIWLYRAPFAAYPAEKLAELGGPVTSLAFSPDGMLLASGGQDGKLTLWGVAGAGAARQRIGDSLLGRGGALTGLAFSPDGKRLVSGSEDGYLLLWDIDFASWKERACGFARRNLTQSEWSGFLRGEPYQSTCAQWPEGE